MLQGPLVRAHLALKRTSAPYPQLCFNQSVPIAFLTDVSALSRTRTWTQRGATIFRRPFSAQKETPRRARNSLTRLIYVPARKRNT